MGEARACSPRPPPARRPPRAPASPSSSSTIPRFRNMRFHRSCRHLGPRGRDVPDGAGPVSAGDAAGSGKGLRPPKLKKFVEAAYPEDKRAAGIGRQGRAVHRSGGNRAGWATWRWWSRPVPTSTLPPWPRPGSSSSSPPTMDGTPGAGEDPVRLQVRGQGGAWSRSGRRSTSRAWSLNRFTQGSSRGVKVKIVDQGVEASTDRGRRLRLHRRAARPAHHRTVVARAGDHQDRRGHHQGQEEVSQVHGRSPRRPTWTRKRWCGPRASRKRSSRRACAPKRPSACPARKATRSRWCRTCPGVGRSAFGSGALIVWGSAPQDTRVNVDGVEIPVLYHVGGMRSTINSDLVRSIDLSPGSYGAEYGRGLGGLVRIELQDPGREGVHGYVAADVMDVSGMVRAAITPNLRAGRRRPPGLSRPDAQGGGVQGRGRFLPHSSLR